VQRGTEIHIAALLCKLIHRAGLVGLALDSYKRKMRRKSKQCIARSISIMHLLRSRIRRRM